MGRVLLVRHGQASFGADDYDVLSAAGHEQAAVLGRSLTAGSSPAAAPDVVLAGGLRRQQDTARGVVEAAGWSVPVETDDRWDEFDHEAVLAAHGGADMRAATRREFQEAFEAATARWCAAPDADPTDPTAAGVGHESWPAFTDRVRAALTDAAGRTGPGETALVVSSGGVIAAAAALLLGAEGASLPVVWSRLNTVLVNTGVTTVVVGATGPRLLTLNDHTHLPRAQVTYR